MPLGPGWFGHLADIETVVGSIPTRGTLQEILQKAFERKHMVAIAQW